MSSVIFESENEKYLIQGLFVKNKFKIRVKSKQGWGYFADYDNYFVLDSNRNIRSTLPITEEIAPKLIQNILKQGETEGFYLVDEQHYASSNGESQEIIHFHSEYEKNYTSTGSKLLAHYPIFEKLRDTGFGSIIRATLTLHQLCSSHCQFCSTIARSRKDSISLQEAKDFISTLFFDQADYNQKHFPEYNEKYKQLTGSDIRLRGLILSGGGQPNLWPHFEELVNWIKTETDIELGLITNGFPKKINEDIYTKFEWIRLSITPEDASPFYPDAKFNKQYIPETVLNGPSTFGLSYVYGPWTDNDILKRISAAKAAWSADYVRILTDCNLTRELQLEAHRSLANKLIELEIIDSDGKDKNGIFHQLKYHSKKEDAEEIWDTGQCFLQSYNVFWDTTGHEESGKSYCYACDSITVLSEMSSDSTINVSERKFDGSIWGTVTNDEVERLYSEKLQAFFDPRKVCTACLFFKNNEKVKQLLASDFDVKSLKDAQGITHKNFP